MDKIFIIVNGSNDLYFGVNKSIVSLLKGIEKLRNIQVYIFYNLNRYDPLFLWTRVEEKNDINSVGALEIFNGKINNIDVEQFFRKINYNNTCVKIMAPDLFIERYINKCGRNIVVLGGHGGPFQCLLDMSIKPYQSINTVKLCKRLKEFKIDLLYLDMCAMNYVEVIYELLNNSNIENIITYKQIAPIIGCNYLELIEYIEENKDIDESILRYMNFSNYPLIHVNKSNLIYFNELINIQNLLVKLTLKEVQPKYDELLEKFIRIIKKSVIENEKAKSLCLMPLNYIKDYLRDENERKLYMQYDYSRFNMWTYFVTKTIKFNDDYSPECIMLDNDSLENIIWSHNPMLSKYEVRERLNKLIRFEK